MRWVIIAFFIFSAQLILSQAKVEEGKASFYASRFDGRTTASGEIFSNDSLTAAHPTLPFGTYVKVVNLKNKKEVVLRINDRGPFIKGRILDVTQSAAKRLGFYQDGICHVRLEIEQNSD